MEAPTGTSRLDALGQRLRTARRERKLSQEALAQPEFTKSYVSAVERGKVRPSLKALELLSRRLEVPLSDLLAAVPPAPDAPNVLAMEEDLLYQLARARMLSSANRADEAITTINSAELKYQDFLAAMSSGARYGLYYQRAAAHLRLGEAREARGDIDRALELAPQLADGGEALARARNLFGLLLLQQDVPHLALEQHRLSLQAVQDNTVGDLNLRLEIHKNLADDYAALGDSKQAADYYRAGLDLLGNPASLERQAGLYWNSSLAQRSDGNLARAALLATRALDIHEAKENLTTVAQMNVSLATIDMQRTELDAATVALDHARALLAATEDTQGKSALYAALADLELQRGQAAAAIAYAQQGLDLLDSQRAAHDNAGDKLSQATLLHTYGRTLRSAATAQHRLGNFAASDELFNRATAMLQDGDHDDAVMEIELAYANLLAERGEHQQASARYQAAFSYRNRRTPR